MSVERYNVWQKAGWLPEFHYEYDKTLNCSNVAQKFFVASILYNPTTGAAKLSLLLFYRVLSPATWWICCCNIALLFVGGYTIAVACAMIFTCQPIAKSWDILILEGGCLDRPSLYISFATLQIFTDLVLCAMPIPMITGLQMPKRQKIGLIAMFVVASS